MEPLIIDSFAGGGGASTGIEMALGRSPDYAINHNGAALAMHAANHPETVHLNSNIWDVSPLAVTKGRRVGLLWASPDCKHFSKAKGGKPLDRNIRDLAWVIVRWIDETRPEVVALENVEEFQTWGPLYEDGSPIVHLRGQTFEDFIKRIKGFGYRVEFRELRACDYGAPTIRKRFFMIASRIAKPVWPKPTHGAPDSADVLAGRKKPWRTASDIIDWSLPCPSIFDTSAEIFEKLGLRAIRPLADNTLRRIAAGVQRYVIEAGDPFFLTYGQHGGANRSADDPLHTITASPKDQNAIVVPSLVSVAHGDSGGRREYPIAEPIGTITKNGHLGVVSAFLAQHNGNGDGIPNPGRAADLPISTLTSVPNQQAVVSAHLMNMKGSKRHAQGIDEPVPTICASTTHAALVSAFMVKYYGQGVGQGMDGPVHTVTTRDRFGLVTVTISGQPYVIVDIGMRMLTEREKFRAQGFPDDYQIDVEHEGKILTKSQQGSCVGNSVCPQLAQAIIAANCSHLARVQEAAE